MSLLRLLSIAAILGAAQLDLSNSSRPGPGTGMIVGQVVDGATAQPHSEAIVGLYRTGESLGRVMADEEGRFFFTQLPAGEYFIQATKEGHAPGGYNQRSPGGQYQPLSLGNGERRTDVVLRVWKYAVIGGTVVDESGEPVVGITVRALPKSIVAGRTRFGNMNAAQALATTDDRGVFRLSQLTPGTYVVVVPSAHTTLPAAVLENPNSTLRTEVFWGGIQEITPLGNPRTQQVGDLALMSLNRVAIPPPLPESGRMQVYRTTYYPGVHTAAAATAITVKSGEERTDLTIALRPVPAVRVSGHLVTPDGSVAEPMMIRLIGDGMADVTAYDSPSGPDDVGLQAATAMSDGRGRFTMLGVPSGDYVIQQANRFLMRLIREDRDAYWFSQPLSVGREDIKDVAVELRHALRVDGRLELRSSTTGSPQKPPIPMLILETPFGEPGQVAIEVARDTLTFAHIVAGGRYIARPYESREWVVQSATLDGKDITDRVFDLQSDVTSMVVTYTDRPSKVSGTVTDARGAASTTAMVLAFPTDSRRWTGYGSNPRTIKSAITNESGVYTFAHLPPGDYYVIAVEPGDADNWQDPARLEVLAGQASRLSITSGDSLKTVDLRVRSVQ